MVNFFTIKKGIHSNNWHVLQYLSKDDLYYEWEGESITFCDNIIDTDEAPGHCDSLSSEEWIEILSDIDRHTVAADQRQTINWMLK